MEPIESTSGESARARWSRLIDEQRSSGLPAAVFCRERSLPVSSYYGWRRKLSGGAAVPGFIAARVVDDRDAGDQTLGEGEPGSRSVGVRIELAGGRQVLVTCGFDRRLLLEVIEVLEQIAPLTGTAS